MAIYYFGKQQTPMSKNYTVQPGDKATSGIAFWSATATAKPVITDYNITAANTGTLVLKFGYLTASGLSQSSVVAQHLMVGSIALVVNRETPLVGDTNGGIFYIESHAGGVLNINASGFEF